MGHGFCLTGVLSLAAVHPVWRGGTVSAPATVLARAHLAGERRGTLPLGDPLPIGFVECTDVERGGILMLYWAVVFLVIALVAAVFGFGGLPRRLLGLRSSSFPFSW